MIELDVSPVLHNSGPATLVAVNSELSQLLLTDIPGDGGIDFGAAVPIAAGLVQPFTICVTE